MYWITKLLLPCIAVAVNDPPCNCAGFLQRSWNVINGPNPCGCNFEKLTSKDELRELPLPELRKRVATLTQQIEALETSSETEREEHRKELDARTKVVEELWKEERNARVATEAADDQRGVKLHQHADKVKELEAKVAKLNDDLSGLRQEWGQINEDVALQLAGLSSCPKCTGADALLLRKAQLSLVRKQHNVDTEDPMELVMEIGRLEMKRNSLRKMQAAEQSSFGSEGRRLDKEKEKATLALDHQNLGAKRYEQQDAKRMELIKRQQEILEPVVKDRESAIKRMQTSIAKTQEQLQIIKKCCQ